MCATLFTKDRMVHGILLWMTFISLVLLKIGLPGVMLDFVRRQHLPSHQGDMNDVDSPLSLRTWSSTGMLIKPAPRSRLGDRPLEHKIQMIRNKPQRVQPDLEYVNTAFSPVCNAL